MKRRTLVSLLCLGVTALLASQIRAQNAAPSSNDRPLKVVPVKNVYGNYRYRLALHEGQYAAGFSQMKLMFSAANHTPGRPSAEESRHSSKLEAVTLERGVTHDSTFAKWAIQAQDRQQLRDLTLDAFNEAGGKSATHKLTGCVVTEYNSLPNLDGHANEITIEHMQLHCRAIK